MFIVFEIQETDHASVIVTEYDTLNKALQKYYTILAAAAVSEIAIHTAMVIEPNGNTVAVSGFDHREAVPEVD